jgi:hypothetical protein
MITKQIQPELQAVKVRLSEIERVPAEHQPVMAAAADYVRLREESWQLRSDGLRTTNMRLLKDAEKKERTALESLKTVEAFTGSVQGLPAALPPKPRAPRVKENVAAKPAAVSAKPVDPSKDIVLPKGKKGSKRRNPAALPRAK